MRRALLGTVIALVREAGAAILPFWRTDVAVQEKADATPVTAADLTAHRLLLDGLKRLTPGIPVISEEAADIPLAQRESWPRWWLVDPLDGTREFISGSDEFTVNVALIQEGEVLFGVVGMPVSGRCYYGGMTVGAWFCEALAEPLPIQTRSVPSGHLTVVASRRHSSPEQALLLERLQQRFGDLELVNVGSSLKFCQVAEGTADLYPRLAPTCQWDTAAAQGVLEGAGGAVLDLAGQPLTYEARESFLNPSFIALPNGADWGDDVLRLARALGR